MEEEGVKVYNQIAKVNMDINYWGTRRVCELLGPMLRKGARVVMVSSTAGWLGHLVTPSILRFSCGVKVLMEQTVRQALIFLCEGQGRRSKEQYVCS